VLFNEAAGPMKRIRESGERRPGCTVRWTAMARPRTEEDVMDEADVARVGRHGLVMLVGAAAVLFAAFLYLFNFTAFF
jgi:hypothetical protein